MMSRIYPNKWYSFDNIFADQMLRYVAIKNERIRPTDIYARVGASVIFANYALDLSVEFKSSKLNVMADYESFSLDDDFERDSRGRKIYYTHETIHDIPASFYENPYYSLFFSDDKSRLSTDHFVQLTFLLSDIEDKDVVDDVGYKYNLLLKSDRETYISDNPEIGEGDSGKFAFFYNFRPFNNYDTEYGVIYIPRDKQKIRNLQLKLEERLVNKRKVSKKGHTSPERI
ncbi:MAG: hypothetical protein QMD85_03790 [Candidatus Aenigmarchaeota archaeon]|nr:hypothetical protein [Candidatus Aenigmarchaeota archaeon]MDI6722678.1 hypothetical protein [Candidatus Aenigmarchaeota archaeon]